MAERAVLNFERGRNTIGIFGVVVRAAMPKFDPLHELAREGMTMVVVTHEVGFAKRVADRVIMMDAGAIIEDAPPAEFFGNPQHERTRKFLEAVR